MRHNNLAVDFAVCTRTLLLALEVLSPRQLRLRRRRPASGDAAP